MLLRRKADMEAKDAKWNAPLLVAAGTGLQDVCEVLLNAGADRSARNINGKGAVQEAESTSPSLSRWLSQQGCPDTDSTARGRTRTGVSATRASRYAMTISPLSPYASHSSVASLGGGAKGKQTRGGGTSHSSDAPAKGDGGNDGKGNITYPRLSRKGQRPLIALSQLSHGCQGSQPASVLRHFVCACI